MFDFVPDYGIPHQLEAEEFAIFLAKFFSSETRRSSTATDYLEVNRLKIQNFPVTVKDGYMGEEYRFD